MINKIKLKLAEYLAVEMVKRVKTQQEIISHLAIRLKEREENCKFLRERRDEAAAAKNEALERAWKAEDEKRELQKEVEELRSIVAESLIKKEEK